MPDYSRGKIYKIEPICEHEEHEISSLKYLSSRMTYHKTGYNKWKSNLHGKVMSFELFDKYGFDNCVITLIENVNANIKEELLQKERYYIQSMKCINKFVPLRTRKEHYEDHKEERKEYKKETDKQYRDNNREKIKAQRSEKITCECGKTICRSDLARHKKSQFHINNTS